MNFLNRLKYYLIGVGLGILMVLAIFKDRKLTNWTPANQIKNEFAEKEVIVDSLSTCRFNCAGIKTLDSIQSFLPTGNIDFNSSDVKNHDERTYLFEYKRGDIKSVKLTFYKEKIEILFVEVDKKDCPC